MKLQSQLGGGDAFVTNTPNDRKFSSSELNLTFEGLLLGVSRRHHLKGWQQPPPQLGLNLMKGVHQSFRL
jgi:hypothetical protein